MALNDVISPRITVYAVGPTPSNGPFPVQFPFIDEDTVKVFLNGAEIFGFMVAEASPFDGTSFVVFLDTPVANAKVSVVSNTGETRGTADLFVQAELSVEIDRIYAILQEHRQAGFYAQFDPDVIDLGGKVFAGSGDPVNAGDLVSKGWAEGAFSVPLLAARDQAAASAAASGVSAAASAASAGASAASAGAASSSAGAAASSAAAAEQAVIDAAAAAVVDTTDFVRISEANPQALAGALSVSAALDIIGGARKARIEQPTAGDDIVFKAHPGGVASEIARMTSAASGLGGGTTLVTRIKGDGRYVRLTGSPLAGGFTAAAQDLGVLATGSLALAATGGNIKRLVNGGAFTLSAPVADDFTALVQMSNNATAGVVTLAGFTKVTGDDLTVVNGDDFFLFVSRANGFTHLHIQALQ